MLKVFQPREFWKIGVWETANRPETFNYLSQMHAAGRWGEIPPVWVEPNLLLNGTFNVLIDLPFISRIKPYILYGGHNRLEYAKRHGLPLKAYVRWTPGNPEISAEEKRMYLVF